MVYTQAKRYWKSGKRKYKRFNEWSNTPQTPKALAMQALKGVRYIKGLVNSEMLHKQNTQTGITISTTGAIAHITNIGQDDTDSGRTGNSILVRNILLRIAWLQSLTANQTGVRYMLVMDKQQVSDTPPAITDILSSADIIAPLNDANTGRFKVLLNKVFYLDVAKERVHYREHYLKMYQHVRYNGTASSDIQKCGIYLVVISTEPTLAPTLKYEVKVGYHDN